MKRIKLSTASRKLSEYAADLTDQIVLLIAGKRAVAAIVPLKGVDPESIALSGHPAFLKIIARSRAEFRRGHAISIAEMKRAFGIGRSPNLRLKPTKARRRDGSKRGSRARLRD